MNKDQQYQEYLGSGGQLPYEEFISAAMLLSSMEEPVKKKEDTQPTAENLSIDENGIPTNVSVPISNDLELNPEQQQVLQNQPAPISTSSLGNAPQPTSMDLPLTGMEYSGVGNSDLVQRPTFKPASPINAGSISLPTKPIQNTLAQNFGQKTKINSTEDPIDILAGQSNDIQSEINPQESTPEELAADEARSLADGNQGIVNANKQSQEFFDKYLNKEYQKEFVEIPSFTKEATIGSDEKDIIGNKVKSVTEYNNDILKLQNQGKVTLVDNGNGYQTTPEGRYAYNISDDNYLKEVNDNISILNSKRKLEWQNKNTESARFNKGNVGNEPEQDGFGEFVSQANKFGVLPTNEEYSQLTTDESRQEYLATLEATQNAQKNGTTLQEELDKVRPNYLLSEEVKINSGFNAVNLLNKGIENGDTKDEAELNYFTKFFSDKNNVMDFGEYWEREGKAKHQSSLIRENQANYQATRANIWNEYLSYKNDKLGTNQRFLEEAVVQSSALADKYAQEGNSEALAQEKAKMENLYSQYEANEGQMIAVSNVFNESNRNFTTLANKRKEESDFEMKVQNGEVGANVKNILGQIPLAISSSLTSTLTGIGRIASSILPSDNLKDAVDIVSDTELKVGNIKVASLTDKIKTFKGNDGFEYKEINGKTYGVKSDGKIFKTNYQQNGNETNVKEDTEYKASGMVFLTAKMAADIYLTTGVGKGINTTIGSSANRIANSTKIAQVFGEGSQMAKTASSFARLAKNADNVSVTGWYVQMYNDSYRMAEQGGIKDPVNKHLYAISMSFMQSIIQRINPDTNFLKTLNTNSRQIVKALISENPATARQIISKFLKETADASIQYAKKAGNNVPKEVLEEVVQQGTQDLSNLVLNATAKTNFETSSAQDYEEVVVGTIVPAAVASLLGGNGSRIATVNNKKIDLTTYSRNDLITELARDTKGIEVINNFKSSAFFQSQKDAAQNIEEEIKTRKKYVDTIPDVEKYSTPALSDIAPILQKIDQKKADLKNDDGTFTERINKDIAELTTQANAILDNDLNLTNEDTTPTNETPETVQGEEDQANPIQPNPNTPNTPSGSGVEINTENNGSTPVQEQSPNGQVKEDGQASQEGRSIATDQLAEVDKGNQESEQVTGETSSQEEVVLNPIPNNRKFKHTKGAFKDNNGSIYKSTETQSGDSTIEHEVLSNNQNNPLIPKVEGIIDTKEGKVFKIEEVTPLGKDEKISLDDYNKIQELASQLDNQGYFVSETPEIGRDKDGNIKLLDFSLTSKKNERQSNDSAYSTKQTFDVFSRRLSPNDKLVDTYNYEVSDYNLQKEEGFPTEKPKGFLYKLRLRPFDIGTYPNNGNFVKLAVENSKSIDGNYGLLEYRKPLSESEVKKFDLEYDSRSENRYDVDQQEVTDQDLSQMDSGLAALNQKYAKKENPLNTPTNEEQKNSEPIASETSEQPNNSPNKSGSTSGQENINSQDSQDEIDQAEKDDQEYEKERENEKIYFNKENFDRNKKSFELFENEGEYKPSTTTYKLRSPANFAYWFLDKKTEKEYSKLRDKNEKYFKTKEEAQAALDELLEFESQNEEAFEKSKQYIDSISEDVKPLPLKTDTEKVEKKEESVSTQTEGTVLTETQQKTNYLIGLKNDYNKLSAAKKSQTKGKEIFAKINQLSRELNLPTGNLGDGKISIKNPKTGKEMAKIKESISEKIPTKKEIETAKEYIDDLVLWNGDMGSVRWESDITRADVDKGAADIKNGKLNTVPARRLINEVNRQINDYGGFNFVEGSGSQTQKTFASLQEIADSKIEFPRVWNSLDSLTDQEINQLYNERFESEKEFYTNGPSQGENNSVYEERQSIPSESSGTDQGKEELNSPEYTQLIQDRAVAEKEVAAKKAKLGAVSKATNKNFATDQKNIFGERPAQQGMFDERADGNAGKEIIATAKAEYDTARKELSAINGRIKSFESGETQGTSAMDFEEKSTQPIQKIPEPKTTAKPAEKIEDFGEKIGGAKKDFREKLESISNEDIINLPLSKSFPRPDFKKLVETKVFTVEQAIFFSYLYDQIPAKPRKPYALKAWANKVEYVTSTYSSLMTDSTLDVVGQWRKNAVFGNQYKLYEEIYNEFGFPNNPVTMGAYEIKKLINNGGEYYAIIKGSRIYSKDLYSVKEAVDALKVIVEKNKEKKGDVKLSLYQDRSTKKYFIGKKGVFSTIRLIEFDDVTEARTFLNENKEQLQEMWDSQKEIQKERDGKLNDPRVGTDYRNGKDVTPEKFSSTFGFRGVEFGNYVNNQERQNALNEAYDAFMDLATVINVSPKALSLNGTLAMAFGARGSGNAMAHYEPTRVVINLTKTKGAGSLAHEWWHAFDNYLSEQRGKKSEFLTESPRYKGKDNTFVREEVSDAFVNLMKTIKDSPLNARSRAADAAKSKPYFSTNVEMSARAFENYVVLKMAEAGERNHYLANFNEHAVWVKNSRITQDTYPYPLEVEAPGINKAYEDLFGVLKEKKEGDNIALFQKSEQKFETISQKTFDNLIERLKKPFTKAFGNLNVTTDFKAFQKKAKELGLDISFDVNFQKGNEINTEEQGIINAAKTDGTYLKAPNGNKTNLSEKQWAQVRTKNFKEFFGDWENDKENSSKVVDGNGEPMVVYHGTNNSFNEYKLSKNIGTRGEDDQLEGIYFTDNREAADWFTDIGKVLESYLNIRNPYKTERVKNLKEEIGSDRSQGISSKVKSKGFDGILLDVGFVARGEQKLILSFDPNQIKSATENNGEFSVENNDIRYMHTAKGKIYGAKLPDGTIYINPDKLNANTPIHEFSHLWEQIMPNAWKKGLEIFKETATGKKLYDQLKKEGNYSNLSEDQVWSEAMNTHIGNLGEAQYQRSPKGKMAEFIDWFKTTMGKFFDALGIKKLNKEQKLSAFTDRVLGDLLGEKALKAEKSSTEQKDAQMNIAGITSNISEKDIANLITARRLQQDRKSVKEILAATNWFKGADGKWRLVMNFDMKLKSTDISKNDEKTLKLDEVLDYPQLFELYPKMRNMEVVFTSSNNVFPDSKTNAGYVDSQNKIYINTNKNIKNNELRLSIGHEVQHAVQSIEGFTGGTSYASELRNAINIINSLRNGTYNDGKLGKRARVLEAIRGKDWKERARRGDLEANDIAQLLYESNSGEVESQFIEQLLNTPESERLSRLSDMLGIVRSKGVDYQIIGEQGAENLDRAEEATTRLDNLGIARKMETANKSPKEIRLATGWERGVDKKWKYEIPDGDFTDEVVDYIDKVKALNNSDGFIYSKSDVELKDIFDIGSDLSKAHPYIENIRIDIDIQANNSNKGSLEARRYGNDKNYYPSKLDVQANSVEQARSIILHEIQHAIQNYEGFAKGGSIKNNLDAETTKQVYQVEKLIKDAVKLKSENEWLTEGKTISDLIQDEKWDHKNEVIEWAMRIADKGQAEIDTFLKETPLAQYQRLAGETEARNVQTRANMSNDDRRALLLSETEDVAREDQIILMDYAGVQESNSGDDSFLNKSNPIPVKTINEVVAIAQATDLETATEKLKESAWYGRLSEAKKASVKPENLVFILNENANILKEKAKEAKNKAVENAVNRTKTTYKNRIEEIKSKYKARIEEVKQSNKTDKEKVKERRNAIRESINDIKSFLASNKIDGKATPTEINRLIKSANGIAGRRDMGTAMNEFFQLYSIVQQKAENRKIKAEDRVLTDVEFEDLSVIVKDQIENGMNKENIYDFVKKMDLPISKVGTLSDKIKSVIDKITAQYEMEQLSPAQKLERLKESQKRSNETLKNKNENWARDFKRKAINKFTDRQFVAKKLVSELGLINTYNRIIVASGASSAANSQFEDAYKKIYKGLTIEERKNLDRLITLQRIISIEENRKVRGLEPINHTEGYNLESARETVAQIKLEIGVDNFNNINGRAKDYFKEFRGILDAMLKNGVITQESYDAMVNIDYQPRLFVEHLLDADGKLMDDETDKFANESGGIKKEMLQGLTDGSTGDVIMNSEWILKLALASRNRQMAQNEVNRTFMTRDFPTAKMEYERIKAGTSKLSAKEQKRFEKYFEELDSKIKNNPMTGISDTGTIQYKYDTTPDGFKKAYYFQDGIRHEFFMENELHTQWHDAGHGIFKNPDTKGKVATYSGSKGLKFFATGNNPSFFIANAPRDFAQTLIFSKEYSDYLPISTLQLLKDSAIGFRELVKDDLGKESLLSKYIQYGGGMDFLHTQGMVKRDNILIGATEKIIKPTMRDKGLVAFQTLTLQKLSRYSEVTFRLAIFNRSLQNQLKDFNKTNKTNYKSVEEIPGTQEQIKEDMYINAAASARSIMDFNQGGTVTKDLESLLPYINAATQGTRVAVDAFTQRPLQTSKRLAQAAAFMASTGIGLSYAMFAMFKSDDDDDETVGKKLLHAYEGLSKYQRVNSINIITPFKTEKGEYYVLKIAKQQFLSPFIYMMEETMLNEVRRYEGVEREGWGTITKNTMWAVNNNVTPINLQLGENPLKASVATELAGGNAIKNPLLKASMTMMTGYDFFRDQPLDKSSFGKDLPKQLEGIKNDKVEDFYKAYGEALDQSPIRTKAAVESIVTSPDTNAWISLIYGGADMMASDKSTKEIWGEKGEKTYGSITRRLISETSDFNRMMKIKEKQQEAIDAIIIKGEKNKNEVDKMAKEIIAGTTTLKEVEGKFKSLDITPEEQAKLIKRLVDKVSKPETTSQILDIKYTSYDPKVKAFMINSYYPDIRDGSEKSATILKMLMENKILSKPVLTEYAKIIKEE